MRLSLADKLDARLQPASPSFTPATLFTRAVPSQVPSFRQFRMVFAVADQQRPPAA